MSACFCFFFLVLFLWSLFGRSPFFSPSGIPCSLSPSYVWTGRWDVCCGTVWGAVVFLRGWSYPAAFPPASSVRSHPLFLSASFPFSVSGFSAFLPLVGGRMVTFGGARAPPGGIGGQTPSPRCLGRSTRHRPLRIRSIRYPSDPHSRSNQRLSTFAIGSRSTSHPTCFSPYDYGPIVKRKFCLAW